MSHGSVSLCHVCGLSDGVCYDVEATLSLEVPQGQLDGYIINGNYSNSVCIHVTEENSHLNTLNISGFHHQYVKHYIDGEEIYIISQTASLDEGHTTTIVDDHPMEAAERDGNVIPDNNLLKYTPLCEPISPPPIEPQKTKFYH